MSARDTLIVEKAFPLSNSPCRKVVIAVTERQKTNLFYYSDIAEGALALWIVTMTL